MQLRDAGVPADLIYRDVGISGTTGTNSRKGWRALNARLCPGYVLARIHRRDEVTAGEWMVRARFRVEEAGVCLQSPQGDLVTVCGR